MDTIVALITPLGRSGIGVIRLSGSSSLEITRKLIRDEDFSPKPRLAVLQKIYHIETSDILDEVLVTYFQSPQSFTGEDVIEISCHGSPVVLRQIIDFCLKLDARMAEAGEFSLRALANGRMNLSQAEAIRDLIDSQTVAAARQSVRQLRGELSNQLQPLKDELLNIIVILESSLEFVEDDLPNFQVEKIRLDLQKIVENLSKIASTFQVGRLLREGLRVALMGRPNVGKSSLFNALLGLERSIVTEIAGTTRDQIHEKITINNIPISLIDTAGLRETSDLVESIGVARSKRAMVDADLVIVLLDGSENLTEEDRKILSQAEELNHIIAINKNDLRQNGMKHFDCAKAISISAKTGEGIDKLQTAIVEPFLSQNIENAGFLITDARHHDLLLRTKLEIEASIFSIVEGASEEISLIGLHNALRFLGEITGETTTEDMLTRIFSTFCIGK
ncbi:MAG: tRNA uridine-5-carboxymethylaminomethyl(34) synthesis GTPase MnmE [Acidobacteriota bacterium]|nr:tRNA uridine-5-carboxymethylaminomethyl(34) synthesis GTPase MnmE [Acidobacteriota bacterium]